MITSSLFIRDKIAEEISVIIKNIVGKRIKAKVINVNRYSCEIEFTIEDENCDTLVKFGPVEVKEGDDVTIANIDQAFHLHLDDAK